MYWAKLRARLKKYGSDSYWVKYSVKSKPCDLEKMKVRLMDLDWYWEKLTEI
jgi:hypothetical protein